MTEAEEREALEAIWDDGNAVGLDGWIGPGRGAGEVDDYAVRARARAVEKYAPVFHRQGQITEAMVEAAANAIDFTTEHPGLEHVDWPDWPDTVDIARAALIAAEEARS